MLDTPRRHQFRRQGVCQGWHGRSLRRPPGYGGHLGQDCTLACPPSPLPHPRFLTSGRPLPVSLLCWPPFGEGVRFFLRPVSSLSPLPPRASEASLPSCTRAVSFSSLYLSPLCVLPVSYTAFLVRYGLRRYHTVPDIGRTCRRKRPCGTHIARKWCMGW